MTKSGKLIEGIFKGETINTPSMLAVEDYIYALEWAELQGGLDALIARADANAAALDAWVAATPLDRASRRRSGDAQQHQRLPQIRRRAVPGATRRRSARWPRGSTSLLEAEGAAYDVAGYRDAPPGLRIWCGATVDTRRYRGARPLARLGLSRSDRELSRHPGEGRDRAGMLRVLRDNRSRFRRDDGEDTKCPKY